MKKLVFVISALLIALPGFLQFKNCPHILRRIAATILHKQYVPAAGIVFHRTKMAGYGPGPRGSTQGGSSVTGSDCVTVGWSNYRFPTTHDADSDLVSAAKYGTLFKPMTCVGSDCLVDLIASAKKKRIMLVE
jgi:hypothetical protein